MKAAGELSPPGGLIKEVHMKAQTPFASTSVVLLLRRVCTFFFKAVKCARDTVGLAQRYSSTSIFQKVDFGAGREREREKNPQK